MLTSPAGERAQAVAVIEAQLETLNALTRLVPVNKSLIGKFSEPSAEHLRLCDVLQDAMSHLSLASKGLKDVRTRLGV